MTIQEQMTAALDATAQAWGVRRADLCYMARPALIHALRDAGIMPPAPVYPDARIPEEHAGDHFQSDVYILLRRDGQCITRQRRVARRKIWQMIDDSH